MKILLASDHAGFALKSEIAGCLIGAGYDVEDMGPDTYNEKDDYDDFIEPLAKRISEDPDDTKGIIFGGSGQGEAMSANRFKGVRAAVYYGGGDSILKLSRSHNDANVLSLGSRFIDQQEACDMVRLWLDTPFSRDKRHVRRIAKLDEFIT
jgi:ribose 5-phosphate isomerase B